MLPSRLQKRPHQPLEGNARGASRGVGVCVGEVHRALGVLVGLWGDPQVSHPQWLVGRLPDEFCKVLSRIYIPLMLLKKPVCCSPSHTTPAVQQSLYSGQDEKEVSLSG